MSWYVEHLHRDGSVQARVRVPQYDATATDTAFLIGRALDNDLVLDDPHCAAYHAQLEIDADGKARLYDLDSTNGIAFGNKRRQKAHDVTSAEPYRLGQSLIRIRSTDWPLAPERALSNRAVWPLALGLLALVMAYSAWTLWLHDVNEKSPPYLYGLSGIVAALCLWSAAYALFGRLVSGQVRFLSHLAIASAGYLCITLVDHLLDTMAFSFSWLWPLRISHTVVILLGALTVRYHLRLADPKHWGTLRIGLGVVAAAVIIIPIAQNWISHQRLTDIQTVSHIEHPALRMAQPVTLQDLTATTASLKERVDKARKKNDNEFELFDGDQGVDD
jgi:FHA domain